jgi:hypothetical protein
MSGSLSARGGAVLDWYWHKGLERAGEYDLSGAWLDELYQITHAAAAVEAAVAARRPCLALWGPSQSGKSTLLSRYLDAPADPKVVSALQWEASAPVVFVGRPDKPDCVHLNPYNQQHDASGCVTRFTLRDDVADSKHPVELKLATEEQALHALAAGYVMECDTRTTKGREVFHEAAAVDRKLMKLKSQFRGRRAVSREVREGLQTVLNVLDDLISADWARYRNLAPDWRNLRPRLASDPLLRADAAGLAEFTAWLFWDGQPALSDLWQKLLAQRSKILKQAAGHPLHCSYEVARLFLDIDAYRKVAHDEGAEGIDEIGYAAGERFCLGAGLPHPAFAGTEEFGLWQGLVWEMTLSVNAALLPSDSPARRVLQTADLLDFPGVALTYPGGERKKPEQLTPTQLLTEVLKRGKTASIVVTRSRQLGIAGFSLLNRIQAPPAQPTQLLTGIQAWVRALGQPWPPRPGTVPLNLVLTFAARLVNGVVDSIRLQRPSADFSPVFEFLNKLGDLANPQWVQFFTTTYPRFDEGRVRGSAQEIEAAGNLISESDDFRRHLGNCVGSVTAMIKGGGPEGDGGTDYFLNSLAVQAQQSQVAALLARRAQELERQFVGLLETALPPETSAEARRAQDLEAWGRALEVAIDHYRQAHRDGDGAAYVSQGLRQLLNVDPELLEPIPLASQSPDWRAYVEAQLLRWRESRHGRDGHWAYLGLKDAAATSRHLAYLADHVLLRGNLHRWLRENLDHLTDHVEASQARRFLAVRMAEMVCFGVGGRPPHRGFAADLEGAASVGAEAIQPRLRGYAVREQQDPEERDDRQSPHYLGFLKPFLQHLDALKKVPATARKPQPGDAELAQLAAGFAAGRVAD